MSQNYTTQMDAARKGIITEQMKIVAEKEYMPVEQLRQLVEIYLDNACKYASGGTVTVALPRGNVSPTSGTVMARFAVSAARMTRWNAPLLLEVTEL